MAGALAISLVQVGDRVLAYDESQDATGVFTVTAVMAHDDPTFVYVTLDGEQIETTPEHPFYTEERGWVPASDLAVGDHVRKADGNYGVVEAVEVVQRQQPSPFASAGMRQTGG